MSQITADSAIELFQQLDSGNWSYVSDVEDPEGNGDRWIVIRPKDFSDLWAFRYSPEYDDYEPEYPWTNKEVVEIFRVTEIMIVEINYMRQVD